MSKKGIDMKYDRKTLRKLAIVDYANKNPELSREDVAFVFKCTKQYVSELVITDRKKENEKGT